MIEISIANTISNYKLIEQLASVIWREHYIPITGEGQVEHMLEKYQSATAISNQVKDGFLYFIMYYDEIPTGYLSIKKENDRLFLSKIYVLKEYRGNKIGKTAMLFIEDKAKALDCSKVVLTVNKNNTNSILAYEKFGFKNLGSVIKDIGKGFVMDDYKMEKPLQH